MRAEKPATPGGAGGQGGDPVVPLLALGRRIEITPGGERTGRLCHVAHGALHPGRFGAEREEAARLESEDEWRKELSPDTYHVMREKGTESPFTGKYYKHAVPGTYYCAGCGALLFPSETKYDSGSGWPSFYAPAHGARVETESDQSHGMVRTEVRCAGCGGHLGHVFPDGPHPTGLRYCINSAALAFESKKEDQARH